MMKNSNTSINSIVPLNTLVVNYRWDVWSIERGRRIAKTAKL